MVSMKHKNYHLILPSDEGWQHMVSMKHMKNYHLILPLIYSSDPGSLNCSIVSACMAEKQGIPIHLHFTEL